MADPSEQSRKEREEEDKEDEVEEGEGKREWKEKEKEKKKESGKKGKKDWKVKEKEKKKGVGKSVVRSAVGRPPATTDKGSRATAATPLERLDNERIVEERRRVAEKEPVTDEEEATDHFWNHQGGKNYWNNDAELDAMVDPDIQIPEELLDEVSDKLFPKPPHRIVKKDEEATQPAVQEEDNDESADETAGDKEEEEEVTKENKMPTQTRPQKPIQERKQPPAKQNNGSSFPCLDRFFRTGNFRRPDADTPEGLDETKRLVERWLRTGKMPPALLKMWRSRDVKADSREEAISYDKETKSRDEVYDVSDKTSDRCNTGHDGREVNCPLPYSDVQRRRHWDLVSGDAREGSNESHGHEKIQRRNDARSRKETTEFRPGEKPHSSRLELSFPPTLQ